jgi:hypothetical protein
VWRAGTTKGGNDIVPETELHLTETTAVYDVSLRVMLDSLSCSFASISFLINLITIYFDEDYSRNTSYALYFIFPSFYEATSDLPN